jgi:hypothetical protein
MIQATRTTEKKPEEKTDTEKIADLQTQVYNLTTQLVEKGVV